MRPTERDIEITRDGYYFLDCSNAYYEHDHEGCSWACIAAFNGKETNERTI